MAAVSDAFETMRLDQMKMKSSQHINELRLEKLFCDVRFSVNGTIMPCHRLVLAAASPYFKTMFNGNFKESNSDIITLNDIETETFEEILNAMYTASVRFHPGNAYFILKASHLLQLEMIENACVSYITKNPSINYLVDTCVFAQNILQEELYMACISTIANDVIEYGKTDSFMVIPFDVFKKVLSIDHRDNYFPEGEEESLILLIMKWGKLNNVSCNEIQILLCAASLKTTKLVNSSMLSHLLISSSDETVNDTNIESTRELHYNGSSLPLNVYLNVINVKTGQRGWSVLKMSDGLDKYVLSSFHPTNSRRKKVCKVGTKLYCFEYFECVECRNTFSYYGEDGIKISLPTPPKVVIIEFEIAAVGTSIYLMEKDYYFSVWLYSCEQNTWQNIVLKNNKQENIHRDVSACTFSDGIFYIIAQKKYEKRMFGSDFYYMFSITCSTLTVKELALVSCCSHEYLSLCVFDGRIAVSEVYGATRFGDMDKFRIFDLTECKWLTSRKGMNGRHVNFRLFHYNGSVYMVENDRALVPCEKYELSSDKWTDLPYLPKQITIPNTHDVVATGEVFGVDVNP